MRNVGFRHANRAARVLVLLWGLALGACSRNHSPVARSASFELFKHQAVAGTLEAVDPDGDVLHFSIAIPPRYGTVELDSASGAFSYHPQYEFSGVDYFRFRVSDRSLSSQADVLLRVQPVNDPPVAIDQTVVVGGQGVVTGVLWGQDADDDDLEYAITAGPEHGSFTFEPSTRVFLYRPDEGYVGTDAFYFVVADGQSVSAPGAVSIRVENGQPRSPQILVQGGNPMPITGRRTRLGVTVSGAEPFRFRWYRNGVLIQGATGPSYELPASERDYDGSTISVNFRDAQTSVTSNPWLVGTVDVRPTGRVMSLRTNESRLAPRRHPLAISSIQRSSSGIGALFEVRTSTGGMGLPTLSGSGALTIDGSTRSVAVTFEDADGPVDQTAIVTLATAAGSTSNGTVRFLNAAWLRSHGETGPSRVQVSGLGVPVAPTEVEDWVIDEPSVDDRAFAASTWGAAIASMQAPTDKARALAKVLIDALEPYRGVPSDVMSHSKPFDQYRLAMSGEGRVWCTNIAAIFAHACKSLGIPARILALGRPVQLGAEYDVTLGESHASVEVFDEVSNRWVWIDPTLYILGIDGAAGEPLDALSMLREVNDPAAAWSLAAHNYDPVSRQESLLTIAESSSLPSLRRFFGPNTRITIPRKDRILPIVAIDDEREMYPRKTDLALGTLQPVPKGYGVDLTLVSSLPDLERFEYREIYSSTGPADGTTRQSSDGRISLRILAPNLPAGQAKTYAVRAVARGGASAEHQITVSYYSREFYAASGLSLTGQLIVEAGDLRLGGSSVSDWIIDWPLLADVEYARSKWGAIILPKSTPTEHAQALARAILAAVPARRGTPLLRGEPFEMLRRANDRKDVLDGRALAEILSHACNALGIPARVVQMERVSSDQPDYRLLGASTHFAVEVYDRTIDHWVWLDPGLQLLGADRPRRGHLSTLQLKRALEDPVLKGQIELLRYDPVQDKLTQGPAASPELLDYFRSSPILRFTRSPYPAR